MRWILGNLELPVLSPVLRRSTITNETTVASHRLASAMYPKSSDFHDAGRAARSRCRTYPRFRRALEIRQGWNEHVIPFHKMAIGSRGRTVLRIFVDEDAELRLIFTWLDLVRLAPPAGVRAANQARPSPKVKCVAWDLDNTVWEGVFGDVGANGGGPMLTHGLSTDGRPCRMPLGPRSSRLTVQVYR